MRQNSILFRIILPVLLLSSCIKPYEPVIKPSDLSKYVVSGSVTPGGGMQKVNISRTSPINKPAYLPVPGCIVTIEDDKGNSFALTDAGDGNYYFYVDPSFTDFAPGTALQMFIHTPDGTDIVSDPDIMPSCPEIDSVYYRLQSLPTNNVDVFRKGIQFYIDLKAGLKDSRYYRWEAVETYEYHAAYPREWYYDGTVHHIWPPDYSRKVCWKTELINNIYTLSTAFLSDNRYLNFPLHFVDNKSTRLAYGYSLLINQYALSEAAYNYWDQLRINGYEQGGLYEKQPISVKGNLHNLTSPDQEVLGYFSATNVRSKRIFVRNVEGLELNFSDFCSPSVLKYGLIEIDPWDYPAFLLGDQFTFYMVVLNDECVDCLKLGGTNIKPDFWPN